MLRLFRLLLMVDTFVSCPMINQWIHDISYVVTLSDKKMSHTWFRKVFEFWRCGHSFRLFWSRDRKYTNGSRTKRRGEPIRDEKDGNQGNSLKKTENKNIQVKTTIWWLYVFTYDRQQRLTWSTISKWVYFVASRHTRSFKVRYKGICAISAIVFTYFGTSEGTEIMKK